MVNINQFNLCCFCWRYFYLTKKKKKRIEKNWKQSQPLSCYGAGFICLLTNKGICVNVYAQTTGV